MPDHLKNLVKNPALDGVLAQLCVDRARTCIAGIKLYQQHTATRSVPEAPIVWRSGTTCLRDYGGVPDATPVLVVPSLINRFDILDLDSDHSFLRTLAAQGFRPLVIDWGVPGEDEIFFTLTDYVTKRLIPALDRIAPNGKKAHLIGYCMGGLLALALANRVPEKISSLTLLATPWDFHQPNNARAAQMTALLDHVEPILQSTGLLPIDIIQSLFTWYQPTQSLQKFSAFSDMDLSSSAARHFVLLEDWLNDGVPLTAPVARETLGGWYRDNQTAHMQWTIDGCIIDPRKLTLPTYIVVPGKDRIVPPESARPLATLIPNSTFVEPMMGHIGLMASRTAPTQVWRSLFEWLHKF